MECEAPARVTAMTDDLLLTLALIGGLIGSIWATGWSAYAIVTWIANRLPWRRRPGWTVGSDLPAAPWWRLDPDRASYRMALREWGTTIVNTGVEVSMCASELLFRIEPPVAGVGEVLTIEGEALFTPGRRCMVILDKHRITVLDRVKQHGVRLICEGPGLLGPVDRRITLRGPTLTIPLLADTRRVERTGARRRDEFPEERFSVDLHVERAAALVPPGWPGTAVLLPQAEGSRWVVSAD